MYSIEEDTRKVQTAVFGRPESDLPVFLPMEADAFDRFIGQFPERTFYCGILLGGCGEKLAARKYRDKKCHFAHVAHGFCRRAANDESSADHLYIGRALAAWIKQQSQQHGRIDYRPQDLPAGHAVDIEYSAAGRRLVHVQMAQLSKRHWETADSGLRLRRDHVEWLLGPGSMVSPWQMERHGYALLVQCHTESGTRVVRIGTLTPDAPVEWVSLTQCELTPDGIVTPSLVHTPQGIMHRSALPAAAEPAATSLNVAFRLSPQSVRIANAIPAATPALPGKSEALSLYDVEVQSPDSPTIAARLSLPAGASALDRRRTYVLEDAQLNLSVPAAFAPSEWHISAKAALPANAQAAPVSEPGPSLPVTPAVPDPVPSHEAGRHTTLTDHPAWARRDALLDQAHEARCAGDVDGAEMALSMLAQKPITHAETLRASDELVAWVIDERAAELYALWERLAELLDHIDDVGDDLDPGDLRQLLRRAEDLAEDAGSEMAEDEHPRIKEWRAHLTMLEGRPSLRELMQHAGRVRTFLTGVARESRTTTWAELGRRVHPRLTSLHQEDRLHLLVEVDRDTPDDRPLLSALIARRDDRVHPLFRRVIFNLGGPDIPETAIYMHWRMALRHHFTVKAF